MKAAVRRSYNINPDRVFQILCTILNESYNVKRTDSQIRVIEFSSGASFFSFGEDFEVIVASQGTGSVVNVKTKSRIKWNVSSGVQDKAEQIFELLEEKLD